MQSGRLEDANHYIFRTLFMTKNESYESLLNLVGWWILWNTVVITRGVLLGILVEGVPPGAPNLDPISEKKNGISHTRFQTWPVGRNYIIITLIRAQKKNSSSPFRFRMFLFLTYSFGIERINTFINCRSFLENHTRPQTKMGKVNTRFLTKTEQKPYSMGRHIPI